MRCPNCRCEVDYRTKICPYCGTRLQSRPEASQNRTEKCAPPSRYNAASAAPYNRPPAGASWTPRQSNRPVHEQHRHQTGETRRSRSERRQNRVYYQIIISLLTALVALNLLELAAILLV